MGSASSYSETKNYPAIQEIIKKPLQWLLNDILLNIGKLHLPVMGLIMKIGTTISTEQPTGGRLLFPEHDEFASE